ncbi:MAG: hypothetical protein H6981_01260 [Gammaproteobacteria bacterium]|nr:hypothetical protein [Gammaproteobacteria bacterium]MCP5135414.1 hypothetical protein [Gammaproteobacteria bacterium]
MSGSNWLLNQPIHIDGQPGFLLADVVSDEVGDDGLTLTQALNAPLSWVSEDQVAEARAEAPDVPVFGLWQTVFHSGLIRAVEDGTWIVWTDFVRQDGYYVAVAAGTWRSGRLNAGRSVGLDRVSIETAMVLEPVDIVFPPTPVLLPEEAVVALRRRWHRIIVRHALPAAVLTVGLVATWLSDTWGAATARDDLSAVQIEISQYEAERDRLLGSRIPDYAPGEKDRIAHNVRVIRGLAYLADGQIVSLTITAQRLAAAQGAAVMTLRPQDVGSYLPLVLRYADHALPSVDGATQLSWSASP